MDKFLKDFKVAVIGGDKRQSVVSTCFAKAGCEVRTFALCDVSQIGGNTEICMSLEKAVEEADFIILPLPVTRDKQNLLAQGEKIALCDVVRLAEKNQSVLIGGMIPKEMLMLCEKKAVEVIDYYQVENLQRKNALPSAEGALMIAMEHTDITVNGMRALVCGYGRIGKVLTDVLSVLGADVTVAARRDESLCEISLMGHRALRLDAEGLTLKEGLRNVDVIFNTVPSIIFTEKTLSECKNKPLYIEIASAPYGIDPAAARKVGIETVYAPSLPGKYAPVSAGEYIFETISDIILKRRMQ